MNRNINACVLLCSVIVLILSGCGRDSVSCCSRTSAIKFENTCEWNLGQGKDLVWLQPLVISECISNAFAKSEQRRKLGANYAIVPIYCIIRDEENQKEMKNNDGGGFSVQFRNFGTRAKWSDLDRIWLIAVLPSHIEGCCDVVETSLGNVTHGLGSSWSNFGFGEFQCNCFDLRLGWGIERMSWRKIITEGSCKVYLLMDDGNVWRRRFGRTICPTRGWERMLKWLTGKGVLIELVPVASSRTECVLECR